jgi:hypothetical protein
MHSIFLAIQLTYIVISALQTGKCLQSKKNPAGEKSPTGLFAIHNS